MEERRPGSAMGAALAEVANIAAAITGVKSMVGEVKDV